MLVYTCGNLALKMGLSTSLSESEAPSKSRCVWIFVFSFVMELKNGCHVCGVPHGEVKPSGSLMWVEILLWLTGFWKTRKKKKRFSLKIKDTKT